MSTHGHRTRTDQPEWMIRHTSMPSEGAVVGYRHQPRIYNLVFDDPELEGLQVKARSLSIGELQDDDVTVLESFAKALQWWNLEYETGEPVPMTLQALTDYPDVDFINLMVSTWLNAVTGVDDELGKDSPSGKPSLVASLPMETLSPSQAS